MGNTTENKAKFFAQYWGQNVLSDTTNSGERKLYPITASEMYRMEESYLELKPLSLISEEDAIEVARIISPELFFWGGEIPISEHFVEIDEETYWVSIKHKRKIISVDIDFGGYVYPYHEDEGYTRNSNMVAGIDYLRSKGYALPYNGLSIEKQIEYGWVKLKKD